MSNQDVTSSEDVLPPSDETSTEGEDYVDEMAERHNHEERMQSLRNEARTSTQLYTLIVALAVMVALLFIFCGVHLYDLGKTCIENGGSWDGVNAQCERW